ncbi:hypothetical protein TNCV_4795241 [Trichonephila clavipes]|nr:hypothetical protein TNCV_4795241 [Trichonephila clavipes]
MHRRGRLFWLEGHVMELVDIGDQGRNYHHISRINDTEPPTYMESNRCEQRIVKRYQWSDLQGCHFQKEPPKNFDTEPTQDHCGGCIFLK